ncbi:MAG: hypothetical protein JXI33_04055 [Candidatus Aminicenantes bacterium]|nr:hypothetical protein [Candidatus Aminicenantes bacterium]
MKATSAISDTANGHGLAIDLLSVDADAHLEKLTAHVFPSPALLPVELVRSALKRKAGAVSIHVRSERIIISDDGQGIDREQWQAVACLGDSGQSAAARENAMALIQGMAAPGIGLLAVFMPGVRSLQIENAGPSDASTLHMTAGRITLENGSSWSPGTRITIRRRRGPAAEEKILLAQLCAAVPAEISINGRSLKKKPLLTQQLVSMNITLAEYSRRALLAIPVQGDVCRLWLLDQGIPWQVNTMAPVQGLVFAAALETTQLLTPAALESLADDANRLYQWLALNFEKFPEPYQSRIESLFFKQARSVGDPGWLSLCASFQTWPSGRRISLAEVRRMAAGGVVHAMDDDGQPRPTSAKIDERSLLLLTMAQKDFLIRHLHLPIIMLNPQPKNQLRSHGVFTFLQNTFLNWQGSFRPIREKIPDRGRLGPQEISFCRELEMHWLRKLAGMEPDQTASPPSVLMVEGRGLLPVRLLKTKNGPMVIIRRNHPLVRRSLLLFRQDRENSELAFAALMPGHFFDKRKALT